MHLCCWGHLAHSDGNWACPDHNRRTGRVTVDTYPRRSPGVASQYRIPVDRKPIPVTLARAVNNQTILVTKVGSCLFSGCGSRLDSDITSDSFLVLPSVLRSYFEA